MLSADPPPPLPSSASNANGTASLTAAPTAAAAGAGAAPNARLIIIRMVLENFKSYAGRQEIGPFHKSFTSIVGPNGSGKSNVIDALLFVFGFRSSKMRQGKLSELIHHSKKYPDLEFCRVEIHFQQIIDKPGPNAYDVIPDSSMVVSRIAYKNSKSQYHINQRTSSWTEVTEMLRKYGIDLDHKRFLILQGEVESISQMKPKAANEHEEGLLEYLEDIIGTAKYKQPIEQAYAKIDTLNEDRNEKLNRVKLVEKDKDALEDKRREALDFIRNENELNRKKSQLFQLMQSESGKNMAIITERIDKLNDNLALETKKCSKEMDEVKQMDKELNKMVKENEKHASAMSAVTEEVAKFDREDIELQENRKHLLAKTKKTEKALAKERMTVSDQTESIKSLEEESVKKTENVTQLQASLVREEAEFEKIHAGLKEKTESIQMEIEKRQADLAPWTEKVTASQAVVDLLSSEYNILEEKVNSVQKLLDDCQKNREETKQLHDSKIQEKKNLQKHRDQNSKRIQEIAPEIEGSKNIEEKLRADCNQARQTAEQARSSLQAFHSRSQVLKRLIQERDAGRISGVYGRLGDLGTIDNKYDVAISTACGALDHIVVDSTEAGQKCVDFLRTNNIGRATFICMDKMTRDAAPLNTPENVPRLYDLVRPRDPKMARAFYFALNDTLVAKDLDQANRIAYGTTRYRVVTLDGKLIDISGTMSGGGNRVAKGGMSSVQVQEMTPQEVARLDQESERLAADLRAVSDKKRSFSDTLVQLKRDIASTETSISKVDMDIAAAIARMATLDQQWTEYKQLKPNPADIERMKDLKKQMEAEQVKLDKLRQSTSVIENEIRALQAKIMEIGGIRLRSQKAKIDGIVEQIESLSQRLGQIQGLKVAAQKAVDKASKTAEKLEKEMEANQTQLVALEKSIQEKTAAARLVQMRLDEAKNVYDSKKEEIDELKKRLDEKNQHVSKIRAVEVELRAQIEKDQRDLEDNRKKLNHWRSLNEQLSLQAIDPEDIDEDESPEETTLPTLTEEQLAGLEREKLKQNITFLEVKLQNIKPTLAVLQEYRLKKKEYLARAKELEEITAVRDEAKSEYDSLRKKRLDEFMEGFGLISQKLKEMYQMITLGGNAELELVDSLDPFSEGIIFSVMPPKKSWKNISNLSGGEKTLSSLALVFALHHFKPTPLYVMDEIDAALDFRNVSIVANYIKERTRDAQFIIISLRNNMFELADRLVGIYKTDSCTKSVAINPNQIHVPVLKS